METLAGKTLLITGASRGIGRAIALRAAADGAKVAIASKSDRPHPKLPGTIHSVAEEVEAAGGHALPVQLDVRDEDSVTQAVERSADHFGGIDILVNNASAIWLATAAETPMKRFDLMFEVNVRGSFACARACEPWLKKSADGQILSMAPPVNFDPRWFEQHTAYTTSKYAMSMIAYGLAAEYRNGGIRANCLWPRTVIHTAALKMLGGRIQPENTRRPEIVADAAHAVLSGEFGQPSGEYLVDENVLRGIGITDFDAYAVDPEQALAVDLFLDY